MLNDQDDAKAHYKAMIERGQINIFEVKQEAKELKEQAIKKLQAEMAANKKDAYMQSVGASLISYIEQNEVSVAEKVLTKDKTIAGSLVALEGAAKKQAKNKRMGIIAPDEAVAIILGYFGVKVSAADATEAVKNNKAKVPNTEVEKVQEPTVNTNVAKPKKRFEASLDELL